MYPPIMAVSPFLRADRSVMGRKPHLHAAACAACHTYFGFRRTMTTESPRKNILLTKRSLLIGCDAFLPLPVFGICKHARCSPCGVNKRRNCVALLEVSRHTSVHISFTFSRSMLQCLSNALTRANSL